MISPRLSSTGAASRILFSVSVLGVCAAMATDAVDVKQLYKKVWNEVEDKAILPQGDSPNLTITSLKEGEGEAVYKVTDGRQAIAMTCVGRKNDGDAQAATPDDLGKEYQRLQYCYSLVPESVQKPLHYSATHNLMLSEYLDGYTDLSALLQTGKVDKVALHQLARHLARIHAKTHRTAVGEEAFGRMQDLFGNSTALQEDTIFTQPYLQDDPANLVKARLRDAAERRIYDNQRLRDNVNRLKAKFLADKECFVFGGIDAGAVMIKDGVPKITSTRRSLVGPMAYDLGSLLAQYVSTYHQHMLTEEDNDAHRRVSYKMMDLIRDTVNIYLEEILALVPGLVDQAPFMTDVAGFAGCEILARTIGPLKYSAIADSEDKEMEVMDSGVRLLQEANNIDDVGRFLMIGLQLC